MVQIKKNMYIFLIIYFVLRNAFLYAVSIDSLNKKCEIII